MTDIQWSLAMEELYDKHVIQPVLHDSRTDWDSNESVSLGYPFRIIRDEVIRKGLADFEIGHEHKKFGILTAPEKVLLYCFVNMKLHFFEAWSTFHDYKKELKLLFKSGNPTWMIDLGCGPGTAALALGECLKGTDLCYYGIDRARPMTDRARTMVNAAIDCGLLGSDSEIRTSGNWNLPPRIITESPSRTNVIINSTYLFASDSLDVDLVCALTMEMKGSPNVSGVIGPFEGNQGKMDEFCLVGEFSGF